MKYKRKKIIFCSYNNEDKVVKIVDYEYNLIVEFKNITRTIVNRREESGKSFEIKCYNKDNLLISTIRADGYYESEI